MKNALAVAALALGVQATGLLGGRPPVNRRERSLVGQSEAEYRRRKRVAIVFRRQRWLAANPHPGHVHPRRDRKSGERLAKAIAGWRKGWADFLAETEGTT